MDKKFKFYLLVISFSLVLVAVVSLLFGQIKIPFNEFLSALLKRGGRIHSIIFDIRLPRFLLSSAVGAMLALSGLVMQTIFRNPLVDPYFLGVSSAAQLGVSIAIVFGAGITFFGISLASLLAFVFSLVLTVLLAKISTRINAERSRAAIVLLGIAIAYLLSAFNNFLSMFKREVFLESTFWSLRGFSNADISQFLFAFPFLIIGFLYIIFHSKEMNIYLSSDITAHSLGINLRWFISTMLVFAALLTSVSVVVSGSIIFIGLFVPHIGRILVGDERKKLTVISTLVGATIMPLFDFIARSALPSQEIPVNVIASLIGAPFFIYLFFRMRDNGLFKY